MDSRDQAPRLHGSCRVGVSTYVFEFRLRWNRRVLRETALRRRPRPLLPSLRSRSRPASAFCNSRWTLFLPFFDFARLTPPLGLVCMRAALGCSARFVIYFITAYHFWKLYYSLALLLMDGTCCIPLSFSGPPFLYMARNLACDLGGNVSYSLCFVHPHPFCLELFVLLFLSVTDCLAD